jgi:hypothetical protein
VGGVLTGFAENFASMNQIAVSGGLVGCFLDAFGCTGAHPVSAPAARSSRPATIEGAAKVEPPAPGAKDEGELRSRWPGQFADVLFSAPAKTHLEGEYLSADMPSPGYLWATGHVNAECSPTHLEWTDGGKARGYFVWSHWSEGGRVHRRVHELTLEDGVLVALTSFSIQVLDEDFFWSKVDGIAIGDGGSRVLGVFSGRNSDVMYFAGVPARAKFLCEEGDCTRCNLKLYVAQLRDLPWWFESPNRDSVPGVDLDVWVQKCGKQLPSQDTLLISKARNASLVQIRGDIRPTALYKSKADCLRDAQGPIPTTER